MSASVFHRLYYGVKPLVPKRVRYTLRSAIVRRKRRGVSDVWPIMPGSEALPVNWAGWPGDRDFAFVLTHDVEGRAGLEQCRLLAETEMEFGFRSSFNFVPAGEYDVPEGLLNWLTSNGFEVGVHDCKHDGTLYRSRMDFVRGAEVINDRLKAWNAVGFRSGFMFHNLSWLHDLNVQYDASTFDTDPFEPQPSGVGTIFPFWVPGRKEGAGYVELPYTLVQDSTLFFLLRERTIDVWKRKIEWIARSGGMALINVHPDYINFNGNGALSSTRYPIARYADLLEFVRSSYTGRFWHALPREVARFVLRRRNILVPPARVQESLRDAKVAPKRIWIDMDNTPHVPFFRPVIRELEKRGHEVVLTARDAFQVWQLVQKAGLSCQRVGRHYGKNTFLKLAGLLVRSAQLLPQTLHKRPDLALSLGARSQMLLANAMGIPTVEVTDYEHAKWAPFARPRWLVTPESIPDEVFGDLAKRTRPCFGLKEEVYAPDFEPDASICGELGLEQDEIVVTVRPPANEAHYHSIESEKLFSKLMDRLTHMDRVKVVLLPRNKRQESEIRADSPEWFTNGKTIVPARAVDGLNLIWFSDLVVSGGGTMNREAAALGVPVYSIFRGKSGAVDRRLEKEGRLILIENESEVESKILVQRREKNWNPEMMSRSALCRVVDYIESILSGRTA